MKTKPIAFAEQATTPDSLPCHETNYRRRLQTFGRILLLSLALLYIASALTTT